VFAPVQPGPGAHPASYIMGTESFLGVMRRGRGVDHHLAYNKNTLLVKMLKHVLGIKMVCLIM
jgi:hypothetical protein